MCVCVCVCVCVYVCVCVCVCDVGTCVHLFIIFLVVLYAREFSRPYDLRTLKRISPPLCVSSPNWRGQRSSWSGSTTVFGCSWRRGVRGSRLRRRRGRDYDRRWRRHRQPWSPLKKRSESISKSSPRHRCVCVCVCVCM